MEAESKECARVGTVRNDLKSSMPSDHSSRETFWLATWSVTDNGYQLSAHIGSHQVDWKV